MNIKAKDFNKRQDLEKYIKSEYGLDIKSNKDSGIIIEGKREELKKLHLTDLTTVFGIKCVITDTPTKNKVKKIK